jgi:hypothetical protein
VGLGGCLPARIQSQLSQPGLDHSPSLVHPLRYGPRWSQLFLYHTAVFTSLRYLHTSVTYKCLVTQNILAIASIIEVSWVGLCCLLRHYLATFVGYKHLIWCHVNDNDCFDAVTQKH